MREGTYGHNKVSIALRPLARSPTPARHPAGLTIAAKRLAEAALEELGRFGVVVTLDKTGRVHFRSDRRIPPPAAKLAIARHGDLIEAHLIERREIAEAPTRLHTP